MLALSGGLAAGAIQAASPSAIRIGIMDQMLRAPSQPEAMATAASLGFEGVQLTIEKPEASVRMPFSNPSLQARCMAAAKEHGIVLTSTYFDALQQNCLKNDVQARNWVGGNRSYAIPPCAYSDGVPLWEMCARQCSRY